MFVMFEVFFVFLPKCSIFLSCSASLDASCSLFVSCMTLTKRLRARMRIELTKVPKYRILNSENLYIFDILESLVGRAEDDDGKDFKLSRPQSHHAPG